MKVIGTHGLRIATAITAAEPAALQDPDALDAVLPCEVVGSCEAMTTGTYDDDVVRLLRLFRQPGGGPRSCAQIGVTEEIPERVPRTWHKCLSSRCEKINRRSGAGF